MLAIVLGSGAKESRVEICTHGDLMPRATIVPGEGMRTGIGRLLKQFGYSLNKVDTCDRIPLTESSAGRLLYFERLMRLVNDIDGTIVECGVGDGDSLLMLALLEQAAGSAREIWAFDSFEGFPEPGPDDQSPRSPQEGQSARSIAEVRKRLLDSGVSQHYFSRRMILIKGYLRDSLTEYRGGPIALLHLDVNLYDSYRCALEHLQPKVSPGGVTAFDEYGSTSDRVDWPGAKKAIDEFFGTARSRIRRDRLIGKYYIVNDGQ